MLSPFHLTICKLPPPLLHFCRTVIHSCKIVLHFCLHRMFIFRKAILPIGGGYTKFFFKGPAKGSLPFLKAFGGNHFFGQSHFQEFFGSFQPLPHLVFFYTGAISFFKSFLYNT